MSFFINYHSLFTSYQQGLPEDKLAETIEIIFNLLEAKLHLSPPQLVDFVCKDESAG